MNITIAKASKEWGLSRTTVYNKIKSGELSRGADGKIDTSEMLRVFGEPKQKKVYSEHVLKTVQSTPLNMPIEQKVSNNVQHRLELEQLKNKYLQEQVDIQKRFIEDYQRQISQLNTSLAQATASINEFAQTRLLELKQKTEHLETEESPQPAVIPEQITANLKTNVEIATVEHRDTQPVKKTKLRSIISKFL